MEEHPDLFEQAKGYEKPEQNYTWVQHESLDDIAQRKDAIRIENEKRKAQAAARRKPKTLAETFSGELSEEEDTGCLICHL